MKIFSSNAAKSRTIINSPETIGFAEGQKQHFIEPHVASWQPSSLLCLAVSWMVLLKDAVFDYGQSIVGVHFHAVWQMCMIMRVNLATLRSGLHLCHG